jgi:membrane-associated PAP2 superfamily phosphatase
MVMGLFFAFWRERPRLAWSFVAGRGVRSGDGLRSGHARGAFFSHNLWAGWWVWFSQVVVYGLVSTRFAKE